MTHAPTSTPASAAAARWLALHARRLASLRARGLVVKVGGSIQDDPAQLRAVCADVAVLVRLGFRPVLVHGGGKAITAAMTKAGLQARFVQGQRYTDQATLAIAERVLVEGVNRELIGYLGAEAVRAEGLHSLGQGVLHAQRAGTDAAPGQPSEDLGLVGRVTRVDTAAIRALTGPGADPGREPVVPVIAPVALDAHQPGGKLNVNADLAAGVVAAQLAAGVFILVSDTPGVRTHVNADGSLAAAHAPTLSRAQIADLSARGIIAGGMLPKLAACLEALAAGAEIVRIVDGRQPRALLEAVLAGPDEPVAGTTITA